MKLRSIVAAACIAASAPLALGCGETFAQIVQDIENALGPILTMVNLFITGVKGVWPTVLPLLPAASQATADAKFNAALDALTHTVATTLDAESLFQAGTGPQPDVAAVIAAIQQGVADVDQIVTDAQTLIATSRGAHLGVAVDALHTTAHAIKTYRPTVAK